MFRTCTVFRIVTLPQVTWPARAAAQDDESDRAMTIVGPPQAGQEGTHEGRP